MEKFEKIMQENQITGNNRKTWEFYNAMDSFMSRRPEITPVAVCSSTNGLTINKEQKQPSTSNQQSTSSQPSISSQPFTSNQASISNFIRKRKANNQIVQRHYETMKRFDEFLHLLSFWQISRYKLVLVEILKWY